VSDQPSSPATPEEATTSGWSTPSEPADESSLAERPEVKIGGAFIGGFALALLLRRIAR
jgi:hypothetical protein